MAASTRLLCLCMNFFMRVRIRFVCARVHGHIRSAIALVCVLVFVCYNLVDVCGYAWPQSLGPCTGAFPPLHCMTSCICMSSSLEGISGSALCANGSDALRPGGNTKDMHDSVAWMSDRGRGKSYG